MLSKIEIKYLDYEFRPCVWENFSCSIDSIVLFFSIAKNLINDNFINLIKDNYKWMFETLITYCRKEDFIWEDVKDIRNTLFNTLKADGNMNFETGDYELYDFFKLIFDTDDIDIDLKNGYYICQNNVSIKPKVFNLSIVYAVGHFAVKYNDVIYDSSIESTLEHENYVEVFYIGIN